MATLADYTKKEFESAFEGILAELVAVPFLQTAAFPKAVLLGGQSGAGKSTLHKIFLDVFDKNAIVINGDEYRSKHPRFYKLQEKYGPDSVAHTAEWAGKMTERLIDALSSMKYNLIIEGTLRTSEVPLKTATLLTERGYDVSLALMAVKPEISLISCQIRYEQMRIAGTTPRATDPEYHMAIVEGIVDNLAALEQSPMFSEIGLYTRNKDCLYPRLGEGREAHEVLSEVLYGPWTDEEESHYRYLQQYLEKLKAV